MCEEKKIDFVPEPNTCVPWKVKLDELGGELPGDEEIVKKAWENLDAYAYNFIWFWVQR
jgi:hypothetical protein